MQRPLDASSSLGIDCGTLGIRQSMTEGHCWPWWHQVVLHIPLSLLIVIAISSPTPYLQLEGSISEWANKLQTQETESSAHLMHGHA